MSLQLQQVLAEIDLLSSTEQTQVVEHITVNLTELVPTIQPRKSKSWRDLAGIAPNLLNGEDAQAWVNRERNERS